MTSKERSPSTGATSPAGIPSLPASSVERLRSPPRALKPKYTTQEPNERIVLYDGPLVLFEQDEPTKRCTLNGQVYVRWAPSPGIEFEATGARDLGLGHGIVMLPELQWQAPFFTTQKSIEFDEEESRTHVRGCVTGNLEGFSSPILPPTVTDILFHIANARWLPGAVVTDESRKPRDRIQFEAGEWRITLEAVCDCKEQLEKLEERGGYAFTYIGLVERVDGTDFPVAATRTVFNALYWFLTLLWGRRTGPVLLVGRREGAPIWERWSLASLDSWEGVRSWAPVGDPSQLGQLFNGLLDKLQNPHWERTCRFAIHWYVAALGQDGATQGAIMMSQAAFELLWWTEFVAVATHVRSTDKAIAADKLRQLLSSHHIPVKIPPELTELTTEASKRGWTDGPHALTQIRNDTVHPPKGRKARQPIEGPPLWEAWRLSVWYLEMCLLAVLEYDGPYLPRIPASGNVRDTKIVPWARS